MYIRPYRSLPPTEWKDGFIVNINDPLSFDIDIPLTTYDLLEYGTLEKNSYTHEDILPSGNKVICDDLIFRFRLSDLILNQNCSDDEYCEVIQFVWWWVHYHNNWIHVEITGIDSYARFLGKIHSDKNSLNDLLLSKFPKIISVYAKENMMK